jgi:Putative Mg2+ and Co2+ transporter CorB
MGSSVLRPLIRVMQLFVRGILRLFGANVTTDLGADKAEEELRGAIDLHAEASGEIEEAGAMLHSILDLDDVMVGDIMVHRSNLALIDADHPPEKIVEAVLESAYTRLPLWRGDPDNIIGVLHAKALLRAVQANGGKVEGVDIVALALPPWFVPDTTTLLAQLRAFRARREHFALVVDEYGALRGVVTLEDILEEIVGDIEDEHDIEVPGIKAEPDGSYIVDGTVTIRDLNRACGWRLPDDAAATVAGLVLQEARRIPEAGQVFAFHGFCFEVLERQRNQIRLLKITPLASPPAASAA